MTKKKIIDILKYKESIALENVKNHEAYCQLQNGDESNYTKWSDNQKSMYDRLVVIWITTSNLLKVIDVYTSYYEQREELIKNLSKT